MQSTTPTIGKCAGPAADASHSGCVVLVRVHRRAETTIVGVSLLDRPYPLVEPAVERLPALLIDVVQRVEIAPGVPEHGDRLLGVEVGGAFEVVFDVVEGRLAHVRGGTVSTVLKLDPAANGKRCAHNVRLRAPAMTRPAVIAHRGYAGIAPENTVAAAATAAEYDETAMVEIDVQPAACGTPVVYHDDRLDGTRDGRPITDSSGLLWERSLEELAATRVLGTGEPIPTLSAFFEALPERVGVNVELKSPGTTDVRPAESLPAAERDERRELWAPFVERVVADCEAFDGEILFSSFCEGALAAARDTAPDYAAAVLVWDDLEAGLDVARRYDCEAIHPPRTAISGTSLAIEPYYGLPEDEPVIDVVDVAHEEGRTVNVWTVDTWVQFDQLAAAGVDGIIVDYPGLDNGPRSH
jgi:glycerophosphoryl diester phosphodiesterase